MEKISSKQHHIDVSIFGKAHNLMEALPAIIASDSISLGVANMAVGGYEDADGVCSYNNTSVESL